MYLSRFLLRLNLFSLHCGIMFCLLSCQDENGNNVDWYIMSKLPQLEHPNPLIKSGTAYMTLDSNSTSWNISKKSINDTSSPVGRTLLPLYKKQNPKVPLYIMYNDEQPLGKTTMILGHTKGVLAFDVEGGFWLIHSVPKFPPQTNETYLFPDSGTVYGQSFLCITLKFSSADSVGDLLLYNTPFIYEFYISENVIKQVPSLVSVVKNKHVTQSPWNHSIVLNSLSGFPFQAFAKYKDFDKDIYSSWIASDFQTDLLTETWQNAPNKMPSMCSTTYTVENVEQITINAFEATFKSTHDHSKFAISKQGDKPWVCIGDINRTDSQKRRGGGTVCLNLPNVWKVFYQMVDKIETCNKTWTNKFKKMKPKEQTNLVEIFILK